MFDTAIPLDFIFCDKTSIFLDENVANIDIAPTLRAGSTEFWMRRVSDVFKASIRGLFRPNGSIEIFFWVHRDSFNEYSRKDNACSRKNSAYSGKNNGCSRKNSKEKQ